jgi:hypothetical protein
MELDLSGHAYTTGATRLDAFSQLHIARKMGPALPLVEGLVATENADKDKGILTVLIFSHISDADTEFVIHKCLSVVQRRQESGKFAKIQAPDGCLMFDDIPMMDMLQLAIAVIEENLGDFFRTALGNLAKVPGAEA